MIELRDSLARTAQSARDARKGEDGAGYTISS